MMDSRIRRLCKKIGVVAVSSSAILLLSLCIAEEMQQEIKAKKATGGVVEKLTEVERQGFLRALARQDERYDPEERMIRRPFSSPGYHTTLTGGYVHPTRDSLSYTVALLDSGEANRLRRAEDVLRRVIALQDKESSSRTYGIWSWFLEEPLSEMSPPDWNWADFCGTQLLQVAIDHADRISPDLAEEVKDSILHAGRSIKRRNVGPGYTNIALMGTYVTLVAGELFDEPELFDYGVGRLKRFHEHTLKNGSFSEYNSPTYTIVAINEISRMRLHVRDASCRKLIDELNRLAWSHVARRFHAPTRQWGGPHSRSYRTFLAESVLGFIQRGTDNKVQFMPPEETSDSLDAHRLLCRCPDDLVRYFSSLAEPRFEREVFVRRTQPYPNIIGSTWLHRAFTLGCVNCGDFWNQRRPLIAYWGDPGNATAFRVRLLHDGYDYSSGTFFSLQDKGDVLAAVNFAIDRGDTHPSLDPLKNGKIRARDFRLRFLIEGARDSFSIPADFKTGVSQRLLLGEVALDLCVFHSSFGDFAITTETGRDGGSAWLDVVLYNGEEREIAFPTFGEAVLSFAIRMQPTVEGRAAGDGILLSSLSGERDGERLTVRWNRKTGERLSLEVSTATGRQGTLESAAKAWIGDRNAWE